MDNAYRNFNHLIARRETGTALATDPPINADAGNGHIRRNGPTVIAKLRELRNGG